MVNDDPSTPTESIPNTVVVAALPLNPFKVGLCLALISTSIGILVPGKSPVTLEETLTFPQQVIFASFCIISATVVLIGVFWPNRSDGLLIEVPGLFGVGALLVTYGTAVYITVNDPFATLAGPVSFALGIASWCRIGQIFVEFKRAGLWTRRSRDDDKGETP